MQILTLFDSEDHYTKTLARMLSRELSFPCEIHAFTDRGKTEAFLQSAASAVTLVAEKDYFPALSAYPAGKLVILSEDRGDQKCAGFPQIRKYQPFPAFVTALTAFLDAEGHAALMPLPDASCQVIGVGSPVARCGKTCFSLLLARFLSDTRPTLFISLDSFSPLPFPEENDTVFSLSDLLFHLRDDPLSVAGLLRAGVRQWDSLSCLLHVRMPQDAADLTSEDLSVLLRTLPGAGFRTLVLDAGPLISDPVPLLSSCTAFYMPSLSDSFSRQKLSRFADYLQKNGQDGFLSSIRRITLPPCPDLPDEGDGFFDRLMLLPLSSFTMNLIRKDLL